MCTRALRKRLRARLEVDYALLLIAMNCVQRDNLARLTRGNHPVVNTGHYQPFKHPHVTHSPPIGVEKLSGVYEYIISFGLHHPLLGRFFLRTCLAIIAVEQTFNRTTTCT